MKRHHSQEPRGGNHPNAHEETSRENVVQTFQLLRILREERNFDTRYGMSEPWTHGCEWNRPDTRRQMLYDSIHTWPLEESGSQGQGVGRGLPGTEVGQGETWRENCPLFSGHRVPGWGDEKVSEMGGGDGYTAT